MTPAQQQALDRLVGILAALDDTRRTTDDLLEQRARAIRQLVDTGVSQKDVPDLAPGVTAATVKADLRRLPR